MTTSNSLTRRQTLAGFAASTAALALGGCSAKTVSSAGTARLDEAGAKSLLDSIAENLLALSPETATSLGVDTEGKQALRGKLADRSAQGQAKIAETLKADIARIRAVDTSKLSYATRTSLNVVDSAYQTSLNGFALPYGDITVGGWRNTPYVVIQNVGAYLDIPRFLDSDHPIRERNDAIAYQDRLEQFPAVLTGETERLRDAADKGLIAPAFLIDKAIKQMEQSIVGLREGGGLAESIQRRTNEKGLRGNWFYNAKTTVQKQVVPALEAQLAELKAQLPKATNDPGMSARPGGDAFYAWALRASTTTRMTPEEVHQTGLEELASYHARMDPILKDLGYTQGSVGERMNALAKDPRYKFSEGDKGRAEIMAFIQDWLGKIRAEMPRAFRTLVRGNLEVKRLPPEEEPGAPGAYGGAGSIDGTIPGKFWINLHTTDLHTKYDLPDLTFHEAIPGHVWQGEYANQLHPIRAMLAFGAYSEGWALYAEQLADELGLYDNYQVGRLGYLQAHAFRACRLVVDTGLHAKRWSREEAVRFFVERNGSKPQEVASEVDRYCSWPGQACSYKLGHSEIVRQRGLAQTALGEKYDLRDFNDAVVKGGNVPLDVLAKNVAAYVGTAKT